MIFYVGGEFDIPPLPEFRNNARNEQISKILIDFKKIIFEKTFLKIMLGPKESKGL